MGVHTGDGRRPIPSRGAPWAASATNWLLRAGVRPNAVSLAGIAVAAVGAACFVAAGTSGGGVRAVLLVGAAVAASLRLLCNLLDGMLAVEGGLGTATGEIFNELPDRLADLLLFVGAGYAIPTVAWGPQLGWAAATAALLVAYVRTLGAAAGAAPYFAGIMAKPRRMHVLIAACLLEAGAAVLGRGAGAALVAALVVVIAGCAATIAQRLRLIAADLEAA